ncbi:cora-like Mg2+ transporter protein-domain-containing protein [Daldinia bambusicola]|nr:cora-like Mg2+ transporter protein-domain-containing protein [Daldinia bambusicola]
MVKMMVNYCVGFYERRRTFRNRNNDGWETGLSIRQLFSNYINFIGRGETKLFTEFQNLRNGTNTFERKEKFKGAISKAQQLFGEIKDIRDELGIIKSIVDYQFDVQQKLSKKDPRDLGFASGHFLKDIAEMESLASRIQNAVHSTLSLLQSEISNFQAEESVKQGNNMMVFTLTTAVFLPLSFLTSLFALDVETFQRTPAWAFGIIFGTAFAFTALLIYYVFDFISYALGKSKPFRKYTKKQYDKHIKKRYRDIKPFAERINKRHSPVKDEEKGTQKNGLSDVLD